MHTISSSICFSACPNSLAANIGNVGSLRTTGNLDPIALLLSYRIAGTFSELMNAVKKQLRKDDNLYDVIDKCSIRGLVASKDCNSVCVALRKVDPDNSISLPLSELQSHSLPAA
jgi:hypothetical protein